MKRLCALTAVLVLALGAIGSAQELAAGDEAPAFSLPGSDGNTHTLAQYEGTTVVLAWFPKAFTGG